MNLRGRNLLFVASLAGFLLGSVVISAQEPSWSPGDNKIAFNSDRDGNSEIYVMNSDGTGMVNLTDNAASDGSASWSPDGSKIAFESDRDGGWEIYVMNADGNEQVNLSQSPADDHSPRWAPDDRRIAFVSDRDGNAEIYVLDSVNTADPATSGARGHDSQPE